jgi:hypothetical protein
MVVFAQDVVNPLKDVCLGSNSGIETHPMDASLVNLESVYQADHIYMSSRQCFTEYCSAVHAQSLPLYFYPPTLED